MFLSEEFRAFLTKLMNGLSGLLEGVNLDFNFDLMPGVSVAGYVLLALGLFTIAKRRKLQNAWMAWVPVLNLWLLGCISDQYCYVTCGQERNRRTLLLVFGIAESVLKVVLLVAMLMGLGNLLQEIRSFGDLLLRGSWKLLEYAGWGLLISSFGAVAAMFKCFALYDLYSSSLPKRKTLFTVLSVLGFVTGADLVPALLVFLCRNKEEGMPPRIEE